MPDSAARLWVSSAATPEVLEVVHAELERLWAESPQVAELDRMRFETGLIEIVGNIVEHAYRYDDGAQHPGPPRQLTLEVTVTDDELRAELGDNGLPVEIDLSAVTLPDIEAESGRGLALALASLDHLAHDRVDGRNRWILQCDRSGS